MGGAQRPTASQRETFYDPLIRQCLRGFEGEEAILTLDTSMLWDQFCLIEICLAWGERVVKLLSSDCQITLLADRGFEHGELLRWLQKHRFSWAIRAKSDLLVTLPTGRTRAIRDLIPSVGEAHLFHNVTVLTDVHCHLATAQIHAGADSWAVLKQSTHFPQLFHSLWAALRWH